MASYLDLFHREGGMEICSFIHFIRPSVGCRGYATKYQLRPRRSHLLTTRHLKTQTL